MTARSLHSIPWRRAVRSHPVLAGMEYQRFAVKALVMLDLADEDEVVASPMLLHASANEMSNRTLDQRHTTEPDAAGDACKAVDVSGGEAPGDGDLVDSRAR